MRPLDGIGETMGARRASEFLDGLREDRREIWMDGIRIDDVTEHPATAGAAQQVASLFDLQHDDAGDLLVTDEASGELVAATHVIPRSAADLARRHHAIERIAHATIGLMGRSPGYLNVTMAGFAGRADVWAANGNEQGAQNLVRFQREAMLNDWSMTHAIINPTVDKEQREIDTGGGTVVLRKIGETMSSIIVRGARALATLAPFADEMVVYPGQPLPPDAAAYALAFSIPVATPGLRILCRDSLSAGADRSWDKPFSSRFDEQDAVVIFDDVEIPKSRVFLDGDPEVNNKAMTTGWQANVMQQTTIRAMVTLRFAWELATRIAEAVNATDPRTNEMLGELWSYYELTRCALAAAEADAHEWGNGTWFCADTPIRAIRPTMPVWMPRVNETIKLLGAHSLLSTPSRAELDNAELRPLIDHYYQGANQMPAEDRIRLFRAAWDFVGSGLAGRSELYERFYLASSARMYGLAHVASRRDADLSLSGSELWPHGSR